MNIRKSLLTAAIALGCMSVQAQEAGQLTEYVFNRHFYIQGQFGAQETLGEGSFGDLLSPNAQIAAGWQFSPILGLRASINGWQSKGVLKFTPADATKGAAIISKYGNQGKWKYNYIAFPTLDLTFDLTHAIWGYNPERVVDVNLLAGLGLNIASHNKEANEYNDALKAYLGYDGLANIWDGTKARLFGQLGLACDFRINDAWKIGIELQANFLNDNYNSKLAHNADWYFNGLVGVKYTFGKSYEKRAVNIEPEVIIQERIVEKIIEKPVEVIRYVEPEVREAQVMMTRDIFFKINSSTVTKAEQVKVKEIADYMKANPDVVAHMVGYADSATGTPAINVRLAKQRALAVMNMLINTYGIKASRLDADSMDTEQYQPYPDDKGVKNNSNRVVQINCMDR